MIEIVYTIAHSSIFLLRSVYTVMTTMLVRMMEYGYGVGVVYKNPYPLFSIPYFPKRIFCNLYNMDSRYLIRDFNTEFALKFCRKKLGIGDRVSSITGSAVKGIGYLNTTLRLI